MAGASSKLDQRPPARAADGARAPFLCCVRQDAARLQVQRYEAIHKPAARAPRARPAQSPRVSADKALRTGYPPTFPPLQSRDSFLPRTPFRTFPRLSLRDSVLWHIPHTSHTARAPVRRGAALQSRPSLLQHDADPSRSRCPARITGQRKAHHCFTRCCTKTPYAVGLDAAIRANSPRNWTLRVPAHSPFPRALPSFLWPLRCPPHPAS